MEQVEVRDELGVHDEVSRDPGALLWTVPLPIHQIMDPTSMAAGAEEMQGRRGRNGRNQRAFLDGFDPGDMEGWVDPHGKRKLKAYRLWVYDAGNGKWSYELGGQLATLHFKGQVTGGEPDLLAKLIGRGRRAVFVCSSSVAICRLGESSALTYRELSRRRRRTDPTWVTCSSRLREKIRMSSKTNLFNMSRRRSLTSAWKTAGALVKPKDITRYSS